MYDPVPMCMAKAGAYLLDVLKGVLNRQDPFAAKLLEIAALKVFEDEIVEDRSLQVACSSVAEAAYNIRVSYTVERYGFILKVLDQRAFQIIVQIILQEYIQRLYYNFEMRRIRAGQCVASEKYLSITAPPQFPFDVVTPVQPAIVK